MRYRLSPRPARVPVPTRVAGDSAAAGAPAVCLASATNEAEVNMRLPCARTSAGLMNSACCSPASADTVRPFPGSSVAWETGEGHKGRTAPYSAPASPTWTEPAADLQLRERGNERLPCSAGALSSASWVLPRGARLRTARGSQGATRLTQGPAQVGCLVLQAPPACRLFCPIPFQNWGTVALPPQRDVSRDLAGLRPRTPCGGQSSGVRATGGTPRPHGSLCEHTRLMQGRAPQK